MDNFVISNIFGQAAELSIGYKTFLFILFIWSIIWKGIALWHASSNQDKIWFIALLILNTAGLLEIAYLFYFSKKKITPQEALNFAKSLSFKKIKTILITK